MKVSSQTFSDWLDSKGFTGEKRIREIAASALLFIGGGGGLASTYMPGLPASYDVSMVRALAVITLFLSAVQFWIGRRWPSWRHHIFEGFAILLIGAAIYATGGGDVSVATAMASFLVILDATMFLSTRAMLVHVAALICVNVLALNLVSNVTPASIFFVGTVLAGSALISFRLIRTRESVEVDFLTGLVNQRGFERMLGELLEKKLNSRATSLVVLLRLNVINSGSYGAHVLSDHALQMAAQHYQARLPPRSVFAHFGAGRFAIYWMSESFSECERIAARFVQNNDTEPNAFAGLALAESGDDVSILSSRAVTALTLAKRRGLGYLARHPGSYKGQVQIREAIAANQFFLQFQPIVSLKDDHLPLGAEALVRWRHPNQGVIGPDRFISDTELTGAIVELGQWVLAEACCEAAKWPRTGEQLPYVSVNASGRELRETAYVDGVVRALASSGLEGHRLILEFIETDYDDNAPVVARNLMQLRRLGVRVAIDDFGSGYSNFSRLGHLDAEILKIDKSFVAQVADDGTATPIATAVVTMSRILGLMTIAEGVETVEQATWLRTHGCEAAQGYFFSPPVGAAQIASVLARSRITLSDTSTVSF